MDSKNKKSEDARHPARSQVTIIFYGDEIAPLEDYKTEEHIDAMSVAGKKIILDYLAERKKRREAARTFKVSETAHSYQS